MHEIKALRVLRDQNYNNLWLSQLISQIFLNALVFSQLLRVYDLTHSNRAVAGLVLAVGIPNLLFGAIAGVLVDRWNKKMVMFFAQFLRVMAIIMFIVSPESVVWIYILMFIISTITQFWDPAERTTIPVLVKGPLLLTANSIYTLTFFSTVIVGNILAGPLLVILGSTNSYLLISAAFLVSAVFILRLPGPGILDFVKRGNGLTDQTVRDIKLEFKEGITFLRSSPLVFRSIIFLALSQTLIASLSAIAPGYAHKVLGLGAVDVSVLMMLPAALGMVVGALVVGQFFLRAKRTRLVFLGLITSGLLLVLLGNLVKGAAIFSLPIVPLAFIIFILLGAANAALDVPANTIIQEKTDPAVRSRIYGFLTAIVGATAVFPIIIVGWLSDTIGVERVMAVMGVIVLFISQISYHREAKGL